ncbi:MAG: septum formation initiator [Flavobacteriales bacterium]|jgi:cell division protein DivIC|nr:septum formation initiator [Flavobacteriales bacterium]|tara:strand:+ start:137 stop:448 length:312 start_codon:yes stop_codon:yes gene_type:complete
MKQKIKKLYKKIPNGIKNRYFISCFIFSLWIFFFDANSLKIQLNQNQEIKKLKTDIKYYKNEIKKDTKTINIISQDTLNPSLEKYLREVLFLSKKNEEIFIIE